MIHGEYMKKILALFILLSLFASLLVGCKKDDEDEKDGGNENGEETELVYVEFLKDDLSSYVEVDEKYYKELSITLDPDRLHPLYIESHIIEELCDRKSKETVEGDGIISVGDIVSIFYKGYYLDTEGEKVYFNGGSNYGRTSYDLEIGSGGFVPGFEYNMIGKAVSEYTKDNPMIIEAYFPHNYQEATLAGKIAYFEVYVETKDGEYQIKEYDAPEFNEDFILYTLGISEEKLVAYEGDSLIERYRAYASEILIVENGLDADTLAAEAFWDSVLEGAVITKYPSGNVKDVFDEVIAEIEAYYKSNPGYAYYYPSFEMFTSVYLGLGEEGDWQAEVTRIAESYLRPQMILYHIAAKEGYIPTEEEFRATELEYLAEKLANSGVTRDNYESDEKYVEGLDVYKEFVINSSGEKSYRETINQRFIMQKVIDLVEVTEG